MKKDKPTYLLPKAIGEKTSASLRFKVTGEMVRRFSELTGDKSHLHSQEEFARRSQYRRPVAHGMLSVGFVALLDLLLFDGYTCHPVELSAVFSEPVFAGDELTMNAEILHIDTVCSLIRYSYTVEKVDSGRVAAKGNMTAGYSRADKPSRGEGPVKNVPKNTSLVSDGLKVNDLTLEDIKSADTDSIGFTLTGASVDEFAALLAGGLLSGPPVDAQELKQRFSCQRLLTVMLLSTSVGMCIPGKYATFIGFKTGLTKEPSLDTPYALKGTVSHTSRSTRIIKKKVIVHGGVDEGDVYMTGKVDVLVNQPASKMPTVKELKGFAMETGLKGKVVLITGASRGIGETTAKLFALYGAKVAVNYLRGKTDAERIVEEIRAEGGEAWPVKADVSDPEEVKGMFREIVKKYGAVNVLVNNAVRDFRPVPFSQLTWEEVQKDIDVIVKGAFNCCKEAVPLMTENGGGKIINISTIAAENPPADQAKYVMAKSALTGLTRSLSVEYSARNIQVNMVVPNFVETDLTSHIQEVYRKKLAEETPMKRSASPVDVAQAVVYLASSHSAYTTGQKIMVTGGEAPFL